MTKVYKLTTQDWYTRKGESNQCLWGPGVTHSGTGKGDLCGPGYIHAYLSPLLAVLLSPIHANIRNPVLWECETEIVKSDNGLKVGGISLTTIGTVSLPSVTKDQRIAFAIYCAKSVCKDQTFNRWADDWLSGKDRSASAAWAAARSASSAASAAAWSAWSAESPELPESAAASAAWVAAWVAESPESLLLDAAEKAMLIS